MKKTVFQERYPVFELDLPKSETSLQNVDEVIAYFRAKVDAHPKCTYIATFDHYAHTTSLPDGSVAEGIKAAKHIIFCFGVALPNPTVMAIRPRAIGVVEYADRFDINFLEPPMPVATQAMEDWAMGLKDR